MYIHRRLWGGQRGEGGRGGDARGTRLRVFGWGLMSGFCLSSILVRGGSMGDERVGLADKAYTANSRQ